MTEPLRTEYIYALCEPDTNVIRYIGKSTNPRRRLLNHMNDNGKCHRTNWLQSLKRRGKVPGLMIIERIEIFKEDDGSVPQWDWQWSERYWIALGRHLGWPLVNGTDGGDGVKGLSAEARSRISSAWIGRKHSEETKKKIGERSKGRKHTDEHKSRISTMMKSRDITWGDKISEAIRKLSSSDIDEIKSALNSGRRVCELAERYGVHRTTISKVKAGVYYEKN